jgi:hypothetical protein
MDISGKVHLPMAKILEVLDDDVVRPVLGYPGLLDFLAPATLADDELKRAVMKRVK